VAPARIERMGGSNPISTTLQHPTQKFVPGPPQRKCGFTVFSCVIFWVRLYGTLAERPHPPVVPRSKGRDGRRVFQLREDEPEPRVEAGLHRTP
jgi:hypothetical protein